MVGHIINQEDQPSRSWFHHRGTISYVVALTIIALLTIGIHTVQEHVVQEQTATAKTVNMAGKQRMLSQRIAGYAERLQVTNDPALYQQLRAEFVAALTEMEQAHQLLEHGAPELGITVPDGEQIRAIYSAPPYALDVRIGNFINNAKSLIDEQSSSITKEQALTALLTAADAPLLNALDAAVAQYQADSEQALTQLRNLMRGALIAIVITLILEACFIFRPLMQQVYRRENEYHKAIKKLKTDTLQQERALTLAENAVNHTDDAIMITDQNGVIIKVNSAFSRMTGYQPQEVIDKNCTSIYIDNEEGSAIAQTHAEEGGAWRGDQWFKRKDGTRFPASVTVNSVYLNPQEQQCITIFRDISDRYKNEQKIKRMAYNDALTNLPNRYALNEELEQLLAADKSEQITFTLIFIDLDKFKHINDKWGHNVGDKLLQIVAHRLKTVTRDEDMICRMGGDEFVLLQNPSPSEEGLNTFLDRLRESVCSPVNIDGRTLNVTASFGVANYPENGASSSKLLSVADNAMLVAKSHGGNGFRFFNQNYHQKMERQLQLENWLAEALDKHQMSMVYQPQIELTTGRVIGMEALMRWQHPTAGEITPNEFIPIAEGGSMILDLGNWGLEQAFAQSHQWREYGCPLAVNISARQLQRPQFAQELYTLTQKYKLTPHNITIEMTENAIMDEIDQLADSLHQLHAMGFNIAIDDFGTGHSSLASLRCLPIDILKIDRSFINRVGTNQREDELVKTLIELGHLLNKQVVAEGIETEQQATLLKSYGCDIGQGFFYAHAESASTATQMLHNPSTIH